MTDCADKKDKISKELETFQKADEIMRVFRSAVRKAQEESRRLGVANVYSFNGRLYYELPDGDITREAPKKDAKCEAAT